MKRISGLRRKYTINLGIIASELYDGGEISWTMSLIKALSKIDNVIINIYVNKDYEKFKKFNFLPNVKIINVNWGFRFQLAEKNVILRRVILFLFQYKLFHPILKLIYPSLNKMNDNNLLIFPYVAKEANLARTPYIITPQDVRHKYIYKSRQSFLSRLKVILSEQNYKVCLRNSKLIVVESKYVKDDLVRFYGIDESKIKIIICPPPISYSLDDIENKTSFYLKIIKEKYGLNDNFIFYPAHFIEAKNHIKLLEALALIKDRYSEVIPLILVGSRKNFFEKVIEKISELHLESQVKYLGYVPDEDMPYLYKLSTALVMPTLFESVSMPIWEAFYLGVPVVSSNVCALPEQVGDAGLLFDPNNVEDMAKKIYRVWKDEDLRRELIQRGYERVKDLTLENYAKQWETIIEEAMGD